MPIRGSPNGAGYLRPQAGRDRPESVVAINRNGSSQSIGMAARSPGARTMVYRTRKQLVEEGFEAVLSRKPSLGFSTARRRPS
jgi:hypothetical protein